MAATGLTSSGAKGGNTRPPSSKKWCFTFNNYSDHLKKYGFDGLDNFAARLHKCGLYVFQQEKGESGTPHLQGCIYFDKACRPMETIKIKEIHWEKCKNWDASLVYCTKEEGRDGKIFTNIDSLKDPDYIPEIYGWQVDLEKKILKEPNRRTVMWYWSRKGKVGKSIMGEYLVKKHKALMVDGNPCDMKFMLAGMRIKPKICILDISRDSGKPSYCGIESIKNGVFCSRSCSAKYQFKNKK